jgi:hypothetical protein
VVILLIAAAVTWSCVCKRRSSNEARLLGAWPRRPQTSTCRCSSDW